MKVPLHVVLARRERLAKLIEEHRYLPIRELCARLGVSEATARRDLAALVREKKITRTYGGALSEFNERFPSFRERSTHAAAAKARLARTALAYLEPNRTYFFDAGTTIFALAEAFCLKPVAPVRIVTSNIPVGEILAGIPDVQVYQVAGQLLHRQSVLLGEMALKSLEVWKFDIAFLSAEGMDSTGLWNSQPAVVDLQRAVMRRSSRSVLCVDRSKLNREAAQFLGAWNDFHLLLTDASPEELHSADILIPTERYVRAGSKSLPSLNLPDRTTSAGEGDLPVHFL